MTATDLINKLCKMTAKSECDKTLLAEAFNAAAESILANREFDSDTAFAVGSLMNQKDAQPEIRVGAAKLFADIGCNAHTHITRTYVKDLLELSASAEKDSLVRAAFLDAQQKLHCKEMAEVRELTQALKGKPATP
ncbi:MAG: hypothetical protein GC185_06275 [Alphaproteobacteria bacterium]|nr:hypothetical protein [Alphaproteobacteria bacterium]